MQVRGFRLNKRQNERLYEKMLLIYIEICSCCTRTLTECKMKKFLIHHTRYDVDPLDPKFTRFICNSCNKDSTLTVACIKEQNEKDPLTDYPTNTDKTSPKTFQKGEIIDKLLRRYLPNRLNEEEEETGNKDPKLLYEDFRADASEYCGCLPKAIDEHMIPLVSKLEGIYMFYESPADLKTYVKWRE